MLDRDTDRDWETLARTSPYWAVLTDPDYAGAALADEARARFFSSGERDVDFARRRLEDRLDAPRTIGSALDFGCGVGRLLVPIARRADRAVGVDISARMRALCAQHLAEEGLSNATVVATLAEAEGPFDWINSYIVLQHIAPKRGYALIAQMAALLRSGGALSLFVTIFTDAEMKPRSLPGALVTRFNRWRAPAGLMLMHDYDLSRVLQMLTRFGCGPTFDLAYENHGGHHGVWIFTRKGDAAPR